MFTVIIAEKELIENIKGYRLFLNSFIDQENVAFCPWNPEAESVAESVPTLVQTVANKKSWRAMIICGEEGLEKKNPFDLVTEEIPGREEGMEDDEFRRLRLEAKVRAYEQAAKQPLTRLVNLLCEAPVVSAGLNHYEDRDPEYAHYQKVMEVQKTVRQGILQGYQLEVDLPQEVLCIARRTFDQQEYDLIGDWSDYYEEEYSRFYDRNLYLNKMRYLIFDILPRSHKNYSFDYLRFLYAALLLSRNEAPPDSLRFNRVYSIECVNDEDSLRSLLRNYDAKLACTREMLESKCVILEEESKEKLSDREAETLYRGRIAINVPMNPFFDREVMLFDHSETGLATDCPADEDYQWSGFFRRAMKALQKYFKMARRSLKIASEQFHDYNSMDNRKVCGLTPFQLEDLKEFVEEEERGMVETATSPIHDTERYYKRLHAEDKAICNKIETRMTRVTTVLLGLGALILYLIGYVPLLISNNNNGGTFAMSSLICFGGVGLLAVIAFVCLFFLRHSLKQLYRRYNSAMLGVHNDVSESCRAYGKYLSHACNMMRGYSALNYYEEHDHPALLRGRLLKKHISDITRAQEVIREVFGSYAEDADPDSITQAEPYPFDFERAVDYDYPVPFTKGISRTIEFMQPGYYVEIPVDFVKQIVLRREELYD